MSVAQPPYLGAAYYPEDWPIEQVDQDIELMLRANMNVMRIGEFAWSRMEPEEGRYDFDWLHLVVGKLADAGIATILGTPTATPPVWLVERYPEVLFVTDEGRSIGHGSRRHVCPNNLVYRDYCARVVTKMAEEFGRDDRVIGWQIDNEVYAINSWPPRSCCCPQCIRLFQRRMRARFGTIEALNEAWCLTLWSQEYQSFDQLPAPRRDIWHHPSLLTEWSHFASDSYVEYIRHQADVLHGLTQHPIGTDMMPFSGVDYAAMHESLDLVQFNHYNETDSLWRAAFWFDFIRPLKPAPFWNTETQTNWNGSVAINGGVKAPGWCRANSWLPIALGGEANLYWLWRQHWAGQEQMHGAVLSSCGRPLHVFPEVQEIGADFAAAGEFLRETRPTKPGLALMWSQRIARMYQWLPILPSFAYEVELQNRVYQPLLHAQLRPDVILPQAELGDYKVIVCPFLASIGEADLNERLPAWVEAGGTLVIGPMSDIRNLDAAKFTHAPFGCLEDLAGVHCRHSLPGFPQDYTLRWSDGRESLGSVWYDALEPRGSAAVASYTDGPNAGCAAIVRRKIGSGEIILLGTMPQPEDLVSLVTTAGARPVATASGSVLVVPRSGPIGEGMVVVEIEGKPGHVELPHSMADLLTGASISGRVELAPYAVLVLRDGGA